MDKSNIISLKFTANDYTCPLPIEKIQNDTDMMVPFGSDNMFPQQLLDLVEGTSLVSSIIDKITKYVYGDGINDEYANLIVDDKGTTFAELVYGIINDYITFGAFAIQVRRNELGDIKKLDRLRVERIRTNEDNSKIWYNKRWSKYAKATLTYDTFNGSREQNDSIFYFKNPSSRHIYGFAPYWSSMDDIVTCKALSEYGTNTVNNSFAPSGIITLCQGVPTPEEAKEIEKDLNSKFAGTKNNAKLLVVFADNKDSAPIVEPFQAADLNQHYISLKETVQNNIFASFSVDPLLIGVRTTDGVFSQQAYQEAFDLFNKTEIVPIQQNIIKAFKKLGYNIVFKPFVIKWSNSETSDTHVVQ